MSAVQQMLDALEHKEGVVGVVVYENEGGRLVKSTLDDESKARGYASLASTLVQCSRKSLESLLPGDTLLLLRLRTVHYEIIVSTDPDHSYTLVTLQNIVSAQKENKQQSLENEY
jgi:predicted regulator of Ras-like GTPase activity (Roadblock/LC7/MglB family)